MTDYGQFYNDDGTLISSKSNDTDYSKWKSGCAGGIRANLSGAYLSRASLPGADLHGADLSGARFLIADQELSVDSQKDFTKITGSRHQGYRVKGYLKIGCQEHSIEHWLGNVYKIAEDAGYTEEQVEEYEDLVAFAALRWESTK